MSKVKGKSKKKTVLKNEFLNTFSIVIANYNYADHVLQAIQSGLNQNYSNDHFEVIVVDDGSKDSSREVITEVSANNKNLRIAYQPNLGQAAAFYAGINLAKYEWICLLDSDDHFKPEKLSVLNTFINAQQENVEFICHDVDAVDELAGKSQSWFARQKISGELLSVDKAQGGYPFANPCGQIYRKSILQKIAPWINLSEWKRGADNPLTWGVLLLNGRVCYLHQSLATYRIHANNFFLASSPQGLVPKVNWLERWPKLISFLSYLNQGSTAVYVSRDDRTKLIERLQQFFNFWEKRLNHLPNSPSVSFITTCKNRLHHLKQTLPLMVKQSNAEIIVVDYGCKQGTRHWVRENYPQVKVIAVDDDEGWGIARARNLGAAQAVADWLCFIDADVLLTYDLAKWVAANAVQGYMYQADPIFSSSLKGTAICDKKSYLKAGGYDEAYRGWFPEDGDFYAALDANGIKRGGFPAKYLRLIEHGDEERALGNSDQMSSREQSMQAALIYRTAKIDIAHLTGVNLDLDARKKLLNRIMQQVKKMHVSGSTQDGQIVLPVNQELIPYQYLNFFRYLLYSPRNVEHLFKTQVDDLIQKNAAKKQAKVASATDKPHALRVAMFHIGRSGSSVLADMLNQYPNVHWDGEIYETVTKAITQRLGYFKYGSSECRYDPIFVLKQRLAHNVNQAYGFEVKFNQLEHCGLALEDYLQKIQQLNVDKIIVLRRKNILRKIISSLVAEETKVWHVSVGKEVPRKKISINPELVTVERKTGSLLDIIDHYTHNLAQLDALLTGADVLKLSYEDDIEQDPHRGYSKIAKYLGFSEFTPKIRLIRTNPYQLSEVVENIAELKKYLKNTRHAWMLEDAPQTKLPIIKKTTNPAPSLLLDKAMRLGEEFIQFTALAHVFDHTKAKQESQRLIKIKSDFAVKHPEWIGELSLEQSANATASILSNAFEQKKYRQTENWLGLSSGFDSRFLLHHLRKSTVDFHTFTFGEPGYADYDLPALLSDRLSLNSRFINLSTLDWKISLYENLIEKTNDKPVHARVAVIDALLKQSLNGQISIIDGYPNNPLIGAKFFNSWQEAKNNFVRINNQFRWHSFYDQKWLLHSFPSQSIVSEDQMSYFDQLLMSYRTQRTQPYSSETIEYLVPYASDDWVSFWLHRSKEDRSEHNLFLKIVTNSEMEEFFDFNLLKENHKKLNKNEQVRLIYGKGGLMSQRPAKTSIDPFAQICFYSLYFGSDSFKKMIDNSLARLKKRAIFLPSAITHIYQRFIEADPIAEKMMRGLITCDIVLETRIFNH